MRRIGLVVGVANYTDQTHLDNAVNDAELVRLNLETRSFTVDKPKSNDGTGITNALEAYKAKIKHEGKNGVPVFKVAYFAGHGVEVAGAAYFLPEDFPREVTPTALGHFGISLTQIVDAMSTCKGPSVVILDMCRVEVIESNHAALNAFASLGEDTRKVYANAAGIHNLLIAYSTSAGEVAGDGLDGNSRYTRALCNLMLRHELRVSEVFSEVAAQLIAETATMQRPWQYTNLSKDIGFSDLPRAKLIASTVNVAAASSTTRLCPHQKTAVLYCNEKCVFILDGLESSPVASLASDVTCVASTDNGILISDINCVLYWKDINGVREIGNHGVLDAFALEVSPSGRRVATFGLHSFSIMDLSATGQLSTVVPASVGADSFHGATWISDDRLVLCLGNGTLAEVKLTSSGHLYRTVRLEPSNPTYDAEVLPGCGILAVAATKRLNFLDIETLALLDNCDLTDVVINRTDTYSHLREVGLSRQQCEEYLLNPAAYLDMMSDRESAEQLERALPIRNLLCLAQTSDPRLLAVGTDDGFVVLIDIRSRGVAEVIDVGGGRGEGLAWMTATQDGKIVALSSKSVFSRYELVPPIC